MKDETMTKLTVKLSPDVTEVHRHAKIAGIRVNIPNPSVLVPIIDQLKIRAKEVEEELGSIDPLTKLAEISCWRDAYAKMAVKPSKFHSSIEALLRRVKKGQDITTELLIVDFYNLVSITQKAPIGAYDAAKFASADLTMRHAQTGTDQFDPLGGSADAFPLNPNLVVYASGSDVLCWGFNTRDSKKVCVDDTSKEVLFFSETASEKMNGAAEATITALAEMLETAGLRVSNVLLLDADNNSGHL